MANRKFSLSFGLVSIPVKISNATREQKVSFHQITTCCGARVGQSLKCKDCGQEVSRGTLDKGYEVSKDNYVRLKPAEVDAVKLKSVKSIEVVGFVPADTLDPITYAETYYIEYEEGGEKGYSLLLQALAELKMIAVGRLTMNGKEHTVSIASRKGLLLLTLLWYPNEIVNPPQVEPVPITPKEMELAKTLINQMLGADIKGFKDRYIEALREMIKAKMEGREITPIAEVAPTMDLASALEASVNTKKRKPVEAVA
jgi:DNA end-binding protein Ku